MHRKHSIAVLVYHNLFPNPRPEDPPTFSAHLSKNLVGEVRIETATFYGSLDTIEARYPGLNYSHGPHRKRLGRFPHHARLFKAFDSLRLTSSEIASFCRWEGTLWARERYERDEGIKVLDTTGQEIGPWVDNRERRRQKAGIKVKTDIEVEIIAAQGVGHGLQEDETMEDEDEEQEESDEEFQPREYLEEQHFREGTSFRVPTMPSSAMDWEELLKDTPEIDQRLLNAATSDISAAPTPRLPPPSLQAQMQMRQSAPAPPNVH